MDKNFKEIYKKLDTMSIEERKQFLKENNVTKAMVCEFIKKEKHTVLIPLKGVVLKYLDSIPDEQFIDTIATSCDKIPSGLIEKLMK